MREFASLEALLLAACSAPQSGPPAASTIPSLASARGDSGAGVEARSLAPERADTLRRTFTSIEQRSGGRIGVAARLLAGGPAFEHRGGERFALASVYKFPIAIAVFERADRRELDLASELVLTTRDLSVDRSPIAASFPSEGRRTLTIRELVRQMVIQSDNTACDVLLARIGGPKAVMATLERLGVTGIRVDRSELEIATDSLALVRPTARVNPTRASLMALEHALSDDDVTRLILAQGGEARDSASPLALVELLARFQAGGTLSPASTAELLAMLERAQPPRLSLRLPEGVVVAHKTGTIWGNFNDVGIVTSLDGRKLGLAVFLRSDRGMTLDQAAAFIAEAARAVYDATLGA